MAKTAPPRLGVKREIRVLAFSDGGALPEGLKKIMKKASLIGAVFRGRNWLDGILKVEVEVDGFDATRKIVRAVKATSHYNQIRLLMLSGIFLAGLNLIDTATLYRKLNRPIIVFSRDPLNLKNLKAKLKCSPHYIEKLKLINMLPEPNHLKYGKASYQVYLEGITYEDAGKVIAVTSHSSSEMPEALKIAGFIASALQNSYIQNL